MSDLGIQFSLDSNPETYAHIHHPFPHYKEAYVYASDPTSTSQHQLTG